ncbi:winged helix DNA-binding protein [Palleronia sp. LCG004]|uniref:winged helix DNA-binding protein n=1 Tax=Palleronia sp. LCG004 TaxID=3079304 RepID=UPI00294210ED|nr:winged helix DNA-binding protein [Palleronia sp. LCG004]WOI57403.1 winged helix DNA-binding protein [Palleronia sp. LCG004]
MSEERQRIVSSRHLAEGPCWEMSELEYGLIVAHNAFYRWMAKCMAAAGMEGLSPLEILVLHNTNHRDRAKRVGDICFLLNIEDTHTVTYALRKLVKLDLLTAEKRGKEVFYITSSEGRDLCDRYRTLRQQCFLQGLPPSDMEGEVLRDAAALLRRLSGQYDQASRAAASF